MKVYEYDPDNGERHCREGVAVEDERGLRDTYWGMRSWDDHTLTSTEKVNMRLLFETDDYDELDQYARTSPATWNTYAPADRATIPSQRGRLVRWFIRKGATPDRDTILENARAAVAAAQAKFDSASWALQSAQADLEALETETADA